MRATRLALLSVVLSATCVEIALAQPSFIVKEPLGVPRRLAALAVGDLNGDGIDDIGIISRGNNKVSIVLIDPDGSYRQGASILLGSRLKSAAVGDFNRDGRGDLVVVTGSRNYFIVPGNGDGTFAAAQRFRRCCPGQDVVVGDFNNSQPGSEFGDDIAISNPSKGDVSFFLNETPATGGPVKFGSERRLVAGRKPFNVMAADFDGDGFVDLAALNIRGAGNDASIFMSNGQASPGTFRSVANFFAGNRARSFAAGDMTGDGEVDIVVGDFGVRRQNALQFLPSLGGGFFGTAPATRVTCQVDEGSDPEQPCILRAVQIADFDNSGRNDLAVLLSGINAIRVFTGDINTGLIDTTRIIDLGPDSQYLRIGRFNDDDRPDMVVGSRKDSAIRLILNNSSGGGEPTFTPPTGGPIVTPTVTPTPPIGANTSTPTPTECRGQGCACNPSNGDEDCNAPFFCPPEDAVCCDTPCDIENVSCTVPGMVGTCTAIDRGNGEECTADEHCASGFCVDGVCCNSQCAGANDRCDVEPGMCIQSTPRGSTPTPLATPTPTFRLRDLGETCTAAGQCLSNFCPTEDLVCCNQACNGPNEACALPAVEGQCLPINLGDNEICQVDQQCVSNVCDGGLCRSLPTRTQTPLGPTPTPTSEKGPIGTSCTSGDECESGFCPAEDGVCCNELCNGADERCDLPETMGICVDTNLPDGATCTDRNQCASGICDGNICRSSQTRTPTSTRTPTPNSQPTLILARGSGCTVGEENGGMGSLALLLVAPAGWWLATRRVPVPVRRRRRR